MRKFSALLVILLPLGVTKADTVTVSGTGTMHVQASWDAHAQNVPESSVPSNFQISNFSFNTANAFSLTLPNPVFQLPEGSVVNTITLGYLFAAPPMTISNYTVTNVQ